MEITDKIKHLSRDQLDAIVTARRAVSVAEFVSVNGKARAACVQRHHGWEDRLLEITNASIEACVRVKLGNAISTAAIVSAFESMGFAIIAKTDLTLDEYDVIINPVISAFPELIILEQDWTPVPFEQNKRWGPVQYQPPPPETRGITEKKGRPYRRTEDLETAVKDAAIDSADLMAALKPKTKEPEKKLSSAEAIAAMMASLKPKSTAEIILDTIGPPKGMTEQELEDGLLAMPIASPNPELLEVSKSEEIKQPSKNVRLIQSEVTKAWHLQDENGEFRSPLEGFQTPMGAIIFAAGAGLKIVTDKNAT